MSKYTEYPDGSGYWEVNMPESLQTVYRLNSYEDLWKLNQYVDAFVNRLMVRPTIVIPNLIDAQADRRFSRDQSSGLKLVCKFLNQMNANFRIYHPHNPEVVEALIDDVEIISNYEFIDEIVAKMKNKSNLILMSSDAGGFKPLIKTCEMIGWDGETYSASKSRDPETGKLTQLIDRQDFKGKDILIVDDICVYGGTFKGLSKLLRERNCGKLYLAVSHMTVPSLGEDPVFDYFDKVFTTNSKFSSYEFTDIDGEYIEAQNLQIINLFK